LYENYLQSGNSNENDLVKYATSVFFSGDYVKSLEVAKRGLEKDPKSPAFNRLIMYNYVCLKQYNDALTAADLFFNKSEKPNFTYYDYYYYSQALKETKQPLLAATNCEKALSLDSSKYILWKDISSLYFDGGDYPKSIETYNKYLNFQKPEAKTTDDLFALGRLYYDCANKLTTDTLQKKNNLLKADSVFALYANAEQNNYKGNYWRARTNVAMDPETNLGLAKPFYLLTMSLVEAKADPKFNPILIECYSYMGYFTFIQKDYPTSGTYWKKILAIDPNNATAKKGLEWISKPATTKTTKK